MSTDLSQAELGLLENLLDALDRLHDGQGTVIDLHALLVATSAALADASLNDELRDAAARCLVLVRAGGGQQEQRTTALTDLQPLRERIAELVAT